MTRSILAATPSRSRQIVPGAGPPRARAPTARPARAPTVVGATRPARTPRPGRSPTRARTAPDRGDRGCGPLAGSIMLPAVSPTIRRIEPDDWPAVWAMLRATFQAGETFAWDPQTPEAEAHHAWVELPSATYVACAADGTVLGCYYLKPNQPGLGAHVGNCGYVVAPAARGQGVAAAMCEHSQEVARNTGFRALQFNLVVATNERAARLWRRLGFTAVGTLPGAFRHLRLGYVDAFVMFKALV